MDVSLPSPNPVAPAVVGRVEAARAFRWEQFFADADADCAPSATTNSPVRSWLDGLSGLNSVRGSSRWAADMCVSGIAPADLYAYGQVVTNRVPVPSSAGDWLARYGLAAMAEIDPTCSVRDALGWLLAYGRRQAVPVGHTMSRQEHANAVTVVASGWLAAGFTLADHVYAAAGYTPTEGRAAATAGTLDVGTARMMAALRGVPTPVG